jgi:pantetheine-phosphate adenylyltransferase
MIAVYAGTFDPPTAGHLSVVRQAARLYSHLVVLVAVNPDKATLFSPDERMAMLREEAALLPNVLVSSTSGLVVEHARAIGASVLIRGIRGASDAHFETELAHANRGLAPEIVTIFLPAFAALADVSSSELKRRTLAGLDVSSYCSPAVAERLRERLVVRAEAEAS